MYKLRVLIVLLTLMSGFLLSDALFATEAKQNDGYAKPRRVLQAWQQDPVVPDGWDEIDRKQAKITNPKHDDIFVLMTDGENDQIVWFEKTARYWKMSVIENMPTKDHKKYFNVDVKAGSIGIFIRGARILFGLEGSEAFYYFEWDPKEKIFVRYVL